MKTCGFLFVCKLLTDDNVINSIGINAWKFVPKSWRNWWIREIQTIPCYSNTSMEWPEPCFVDKLIDITKMTNDLESESLPAIAKACDKHLFPNALCPWDYSEFIHFTGSISFDLVVQRLIPNCSISLMSKPCDIENLCSMRDDCMRDDCNDYDC